MNPDREKWNARYREQADIPPPSPFLLSLDAQLPRTGRALDVAGGSGRHALWLAERGLDVTLCDVSDAALEAATSAARERGLHLRTLQADLENGPFPEGAWDAVLCFYFLHRPLFPKLAQALAPGGLLVVAHATRKNLERHPRPGPAHLLDEGELPRLVEGLDVLQYEEGWTEADRHEARLLAQKSSVR